MSALTATELAQIRADVADLLPDTGGAILSTVRVSDGAGGWTETDGTVTSGLAYRLDPVRGAQTVSGGALQSFHTFMLTLPYDVTLTAEHRFRASDGQTYDVVSVDSGKSWDVATRAQVEKI
jgi:hypothetical protein